MIYIIALRLFYLLLNGLLFFLAGIILKDLRETNRQRNIIALLTVLERVINILAILKIGLTFIWPTTDILYYLFNFYMAFFWIGFVGTHLVRLRKYYFQQIKLRQLGLRRSLPGDDPSF